MVFGFLRPRAVVRVNEAQQELRRPIMSPRVLFLIRRPPSVQQRLRLLYIKRPDQQKRRINHA